MLKQESLLANDLLLLLKKENYKFTREQEAWSLEIDNETGNGQSCDLFNITTGLLTLKKFKYVDFITENPTIASTCKLRELVLMSLTQPN